MIDFRVIGPVRFAKRRYSRRERRKKLYIRDVDKQMQAYINQHPMTMDEAREMYTELEQKERSKQKNVLI